MNPDKFSCRGFFMSKGASVYPLYIRKFTYSAEDVDCNLCTEYTRKIGCRHEVCPFLAERIEAGVVSYQSAIKAMIPRRSILWNRLRMSLGRDRRSGHPLSGLLFHRHRNIRRLRIDASELTAIIFICCNDG